MIQKVASSLTEAFQVYYSLRLHKIHRFEPKTKIEQQVGNFLLKTAETSAELKAAFQLRYDVFYSELKGSPKENKLDIDEFDFHCDHLIIVDEKTGAVVGTYRLRVSSDPLNEFVSVPFYSSREFNISRILTLEGRKLELGRACIRKEYRSGLIISLLWKGISKYMSKNQAQILFGCASFQIKTSREAALIHRYFFEEKKYTPEYHCPPTLAYKMPDFEAWEAHFKRLLTAEERTEAESLVPSLCKAYLKMGAYLGGEPAWDEEFNCIDFLTILNREDLNRSLWHRYKP